PLAERGKRADEQADPGSASREGRVVRQQRGELGLPTWREVTDDQSESRPRLALGHGTVNDALASGQPTQCASHRVREAAHASPAFAPVQASVLAGWRVQLSARPGGLRPARAPLAYSVDPGWVAAKDTMEADIRKVKHLF